MFQIEGFKGYPLICGVSNRRLKTEEFLSRLGISGFPFARLDQVHGGSIARIGGGTSLKEKIPSCDGAITDTRGVPLVVLTADCLPIFLYDPVKDAIGIAHAGWRGASEGIAKNIVNAMKDEFGSKAGEIIVGFGPAIRQCCYEVKKEFLMHFQGTIAKMAHKYYFDLTGENANQLLSAGIRSGNIFDCDICTSCRNDEFYSYRKEKDNAGRLISLIMLR